MERGALVVAPIKTREKYEKSENPISRVFRGQRQIDAARSEANAKNANNPIGVRIIRFSRGRGTDLLIGRHD